MTLYDQLIEEGIEKGIEQGWTQGEAAILERQLTRRFGALPDWALQKLQSASQPQLESWGDNILDATTLEQVFAGANSL